MWSESESMAHATGTRMLAALFVLIGGVTVVGVVIFWPMAYLLWRKAEQIESEREAELEAVGASA